METSASFEARYAPSSYPTGLVRDPDMGAAAITQEKSAISSAFGLKTAATTFRKCNDFDD